MVAAGQAQAATTLRAPQAPAKAMAAIGDRLLVGALPIHQYRTIHLTPYRQRLHRQHQLLQLMTLGHSQHNQQLQRPTRGHLRLHHLLQPLLIMILGPPLLRLRLQLLLVMILGPPLLLLRLQLLLIMILGQLPLLLRLQLQLLLTMILGQLRQLLLPLQLQQSVILGPPLLQPLRL